MPGASGLYVVYPSRYLPPYFDRWVWMSTQEPGADPMTSSAIRCTSQNQRTIKELKQREYDFMHDFAVRNGDHLHYSGHRHDRYSENGRHF